MGYSSQDIEIIHCQSWLVVAICKHHGIRQLSLQGEQLSSNETEVEQFIKLAQEQMEEKHLTLEQIYNCDKTGLNYRCYQIKP